MDSQKVENQDVWCVCAHGYKTNLINVSTWYIVKYPYYFCSSSIFENTLKLKTGRERVQYYLKKCSPKLTKMYFLQHSSTQPQKEPRWTPSLQREALLRHRTSSTLQATPLHHPSWNERAIVQSTIFLDLKVRASQNLIGNRLLVNHWLHVGHSLSGEKHSVFMSTTLWRDKGENEVTRKLRQLAEKTQLQSETSKQLQRLEDTTNGHHWGQGDSVAFSTGVYQGTVSETEAGLSMIYCWVKTANFRRVWALWIPLCLRHI